MTKRKQSEPEPEPAEEPAPTPGSLVTDEDGNWTVVPPAEPQEPQE